jgi:hypothetical protein
MPDAEHEELPALCALPDKAAFGKEDWMVSLAAFVA